MKVSHIVLVLSILALVVIFISRRMRAKSGVPQGEIIYADNEALQTLTQPLSDPQTGLLGKPDYILRQKDSFLIPLEYKSGLAPESPYETHVLQLLAYCRLVEVNYNLRPPYGILRYRDREFQIPYSHEHEDELLKVIQEIRQYEGMDSAPERSHGSPSRCRACGYRQHCDRCLLFVA
ncbi:MAG: CRISPR-associated protein Cas4 [Anaerolineaceae bacterium]|nr:CRISPR-associated protein Cas4 [Anaerolineaceae bacterium]